MEPELLTTLDRFVTNPTPIPVVEGIIEMSTTDTSNHLSHPSATRALNGHRTETQVLHRLALVRHQHGISLRCMASRMGTSIAVVEQQEKEKSDLFLSDLYKWQSALDVPIAELLVEPGAKLSPNVRCRAALLRVMKTVRSMQRHMDDDALRALVDGLEGQLVELMPELAYVDSWPSVGQRRSQDEIAPIEERIFRFHTLEGMMHESSDSD